MSFNLITAEADKSVGIIDVEPGLLWMQVPCAVDSGACAHVAPPDLFATLGPRSHGYKPRFDGADGLKIQHVGELNVNGVLGHTTKINTLFNAAKITRPLLSITQMTSSGHHICFAKMNASS